MNESMKFHNVRALLERRESRKVANNTYVRREGDGYAMRLHATDIVTWDSFGTITLESGGWCTPTTKERMNRALSSRGLSIHASRGVWRLWSHAEHAEVADYRDGIMVDLSGMIVGPFELTTGDPSAKLKRQIRAYSKLYSAEKVRELVADAAEHGTAGDCWCCAMRTADGQTLGESTGDVSHLVSHVDESYVMASLMLAALEHKGYRDPAFIMNRVPDAVADAVYKYMRDMLTRTPGGVGGAVKYERSGWRS